MHTHGNVPLSTFNLPTIIFCKEQTKYRLKRAIPLNNKRIQRVRSFERGVRQDACLSGMEVKGQWGKEEQNGGVVHPDDVAMYTDGPGVESGAAPLQSSVRNLEYDSLGVMSM
uniref:Uncharacterized protein n=1 Tax=Physcomitrium patens TaxID=3218 RepID=A0A2K1ITR1_PHYPA|nr:hypothetical protein PHYPA_024590 [Physcomitrium patens]